MVLVYSQKMTNPQKNCRLVRLFNKKPLACLTENLVKIRFGLRNTGLKSSVPQMRNPHKGNIGPSLPSEQARLNYYC